MSCEKYTTTRLISVLLTSTCFNPIPPELFGSGAAWGGGEVPAAYNSKTINDNETKLGGVVKDH